MSQNDFNIANQGFPATRADINSALQALASNSAGTAEPSTTYAYQFWYDETNELLKMRNSDNDAWITIGTFDQVADTFTPAGLTTDKIEEGNSSVEVVDTGTGYVAITVDGVEAMRVDGDGRVKIGTTSNTPASANEAGIVFGDNTAGTPAVGVSSFCANNSAPLLLTRRLSDGNVLGIADDTTTRGALRVNSSDLEIDSGINLRFRAGGSERCRIDSSGFVGIGTSSPQRELQIHDASSANAFLAINHTGVGSGATDGMLLGVDASGDAIVHNYENTNMIFRTNDIERMRILSGGNVLIGRTSNFGGGFKFALDHSGNSLGQAVTSDATGTKYAMLFHDKNSGDSGSITYSGTSTSFNTSSDYRLKEDVQPMSGAVDRVLALNPVNFAWKHDGSRVDGFIAHEAQAIVPEAVTGEKDAIRLEQYEVEPALGEIYTPAQPATYDEEGVELTPATDEIIHSANVERPAELLDGQQWREITPAVMGEREVPDYQGIDQSKLVPLLTAALQEALQKIDALEARVTALGG